jgi:hypothetical protein
MLHSRIIWLFFFFDFDRCCCDESVSGKDYRLVVMVAFFRVRWSFLVCCRRKSSLMEASRPELWPRVEPHTHHDAKSCQQSGPLLALKEAFSAPKWLLSVVQVRLRLPGSPKTSPIAQDFPHVKFPPQSTLPRESRAPLHPRKISQLMRMGQDLCRNYLDNLNTCHCLHSCYRSSCASPSTPPVLEPTTRSAHDAPREVSTSPTNQLNEPSDVTRASTLPLRLYPQPLSLELRSQNVWCPR